MSPEYVRPYVKAQKNDDRDAEAIAEAATRPTMRFVALKSEAQLDVQTLHRVARPPGRPAHGADQPDAQPPARARHRRSAGAAQAAASSSPSCWPTEACRCQPAGSGACWRTCRSNGALLDRRIAAFDDEFAAMARDDAAARRLATIPGIGVLNATALVAAIGDGETFSRGRDLSAWLGLVPRQATTGGKPKLLGITKRGSKYLRKLLIQGARAALPSLARTATPSGQLVARSAGASARQRRRRGAASKLARTAWALLRNESEFTAPRPSVA